MSEKVESFHNGDKYIAGAAQGKFLLAPTAELSIKFMHLVVTDPALLVFLRQRIKAGLRAASPFINNIFNLEYTPKGLE